MKQLNGNAYFLMGLMAVMLVVIFWALFGLQYIESKILPIALGGGVIIFAAIELKRALRGGQPTSELQMEEDEGMAGVAEAGEWRRYILNGAWIAGFVIGIYLVGFYAASSLLLLLYMRWLGTKWITAILSAIAAPIIIYVAFEVLLVLELYRGLLFGGHA
ncbi:MAG: tripartite tricarboxylate transporter TctB family protein [Chloroflexi bacterium]|nr:tripartite tricarboxylate transporter TctB family protein [Chloroflexota bacterium]